MLCRINDDIQYFPSVTFLLSFYWEIVGWAIVGKLKWRWLTILSWLWIPEKKNILHFCRDTGNCRLRIFKTLFMGTQNNLLCGLPEIFIKNMNISVKMIIAKYYHYLHRVIGCLLASFKFLNEITAVKSIWEFYPVFFFFWFLAAVFSGGFWWSCTYTLKENVLALYVLLWSFAQ